MVYEEIGRESGQMNFVLEMVRTWACRIGDIKRGAHSEINLGRKDMRCACVLVSG